MAKAKTVKPVMQPKQIDKLVREGFEKSIPDLVKEVLKINVAEREKLLIKIELTKEREPDYLEKVTDAKGEVFVLQMEWQTADDNEMLFRMIEYWGLLLRKFKLPVRQFVIYLDEKQSKMQNRYQWGKNNFEYELIHISKVDYNIPLRSENVDLKLLAILCDFGKDTLPTALTRIVNEVLQNTHSNLEKEKRKNQLRGYASFRNFTLEDIEIMERTMFKTENDILYRLGQHAGQHEGFKAGQQAEKYEFVTALILADKFTVSEIANFASVDESFIKKVRAKLKQRK
jgi:hypothetical protein